MSKKILFMLFSLSIQLSHAKSRILDIDTFLQIATQKDDKFQEILTDNLAIKYREDLRLTPQALVTKIKSEYGTSLGNDTNGINTLVSLEKLFRKTGTTLSATYNSINFNPTQSAKESLTMSLSQDIAKNAFGKISRKEAKIVGIENNIIEYQVVEAYEDYLANLHLKYFDWYLTYKNKEAAESFYLDAQSQEANMKARKGKNIAHKIEVDKMILQTLSKKEALISSERQYLALHNEIKEIIRDNNDTSYTPSETFKHTEQIISLKNDLEKMFTTSRTYKILSLLETQKTHEVNYYTDDLLPSIKLHIDHTTYGNDRVWGSETTKNVFAGFLLTYPFGDSQKKAKLNTLKLDLQKTRLTAGAKKSFLRSQLFTLYNQIEENREKTTILKNKTLVANRIYDEENKNYRQGQSTLNDLISAWINLENFRLSSLATEVTLKKLIVEWLRLTDTLVEKHKL